MAQMQALLAQMSMPDLMALMMQQGQQAVGTAGVAAAPAAAGGFQHLGQHQFGGAHERTDDWYCSGCADKQFGKNPQCRNCGTSKEFGVSDVSQIPDVIEKFLGGRVDAALDAQFRNLDPAMQKTIIERGSLFTARDPNAVLRTRMNEAGAPGKGKGKSSGFQGGFESVAMPGFSHDPQAPRAGDWYCANCQDLQFGKNSACRRCGLPREQVDHGKPELDPVAFLAPYAIDEDKKLAFMKMDAGMQEQIMLKGSLAGARDPTAVLCQRMGQAIQSAKTARQIAMAAGAPQHGPRPGDWYCSVCHDLQFARNETCRTCNTPRAVADTGDIPKLDAVQWISMFQIDEDKKEQFLGMDPQMQQNIIGEGTLHGARDATAVLVSRMNKFLKLSKGMIPGGKGAGTFGPAAGKSNMAVSGPYGGDQWGGSSGAWDGSSGDGSTGGGGTEDEWAWISYAKGFLQAMKGKGKGM